jgi:hypothetical protein
MRKYAGGRKEGSRKGHGRHDGAWNRSIYGIVANKAVARGASGWESYSGSITSVGDSVAANLVPRPSLKRRRPWLFLAAC